MTWYYYIAWVLIISQLAFVYQMRKNYRYTFKKLRQDRHEYCPKTVLIVPCKGRDTNFEQNIASFFNLDHKNYLLWFVVEDRTDPAYDILQKLKDDLSRTSKAQNVQLFVAGKVTSQNNSVQNHKTRTYSSSQKINNILYCYHRIHSDVQIMAFADSDICVPANWLSHLVYPLRKSNYGAATGYRWFVPKRNNFATLALTCVNAKIAQLLGELSFNQAWGGSMAIRVNTFRELGLDKIWQNTLSDDLSLSIAVKKAGKKIVFVPACLVASHEQISWKEFFEFARRQLLITRICAPKTWWFGLFGSLYSTLGLWGTTGMAVYASAIKNTHILLFITVPILFFVGQFIRAVLRQKNAVNILENEREKMKVAMAADIIGFWLWSFFLLFFIISSAFGKTIRWRGVRYKLLSPTQTVSLEN